MTDIVHELKVRPPITLGTKAIFKLAPYETFVMLSPQERDEVVAEIERLRRDANGQLIPVADYAAGYEHGIEVERERCARRVDAAAQRWATNGGIGQYVVEECTAIAAAIRKGE